MDVPQTGLDLIWCAISLDFRLLGFSVDINTMSVLFL